MSNPQSQQVKNNFVNHPYVQQAQRVVQGQVNQLDAELNKYPVLRDIEAKTKVPKAYGALALGGSAVLLIFFNLFGLAQPISNLIGWGLPAYLSIQAIETPGTNDDKQWLTYWIVFGTCNLIESIAIRPILYWVPFYFVFKTVFIIWLFLPATRGAETVYFSVLRPIANNIGARQAPLSSSSASSFGTSTSSASTSAFNPTAGSTSSGLGHTSSGLGHTSSGLGHTSSGLGQTSSGLGQTSAAHGAGVPVGGTTGSAL